MSKFLRRASREICPENLNRQSKRCLKVCGSSTGGETSFLDVGGGSLSGRGMDILLFCDVLGCCCGGEVEVCSPHWGQNKESSGISDPHLWQNMIGLLSMHVLQLRSHLQI